jgi:hypothetical protein
MRKSLNLVPLALIGNRLLLMGGIDRCILVVLAVAGCSRAKGLALLLEDLG